MSEISADMRESADANAEALQHDTGNSQSDLNDIGYDESVNADPDLGDAVPRENYEGLGNRDIGQGESNFDRAFNEARRSAMLALAQGIDQAAALALQSMVDTLDEVRSVTETVSEEATSLATSAASGLLKPVTQDEIDDFVDELEAARDQGRLASREMANLAARRRASRVAGGEQSPDNMPVAQTIPNRPLVRTSAPSEPGDREDQGQSLSVGRPGQTRSGIAVDVIARFSGGLRQPTLSRPHLTALCAAAHSLERLKQAQARAKRLVKKMRRIHLSLSDMLGAGFFSGFRENLENQAAGSVSFALSAVNDVIDAAEGFANAVARPLSMFVSTVDTVGTVPDTQPSTSGLSSICGLKIEKLCELLGLVEVGQSLNVDLGLSITVPDMRGRIRMILDAPPETIIPHHVVVPGQEADLLLVSVDGQTLVARFSRATAQTHYSRDDEAFIERPDVFGDGPGRLVVVGNGTQADVEFEYVDVTFSSVTGNYTFTLTSAPGERVPTVRGEADPTALAGLTGTAPGADPTVPPASWNPTITFPVGSTAITLRVPEAQARDISLPCDLALGFGEQILIAGEYDATVPFTVRSLTGPVFESWHQGLWIEIGPATSIGVAARRQIISVSIDGTTVTYVGGNIVGHLEGGTRGVFRLTADAFEVCRATSMVDGPHRDLKAFSIPVGTSRPHARMRAIPQTAIRVVPDVRDSNLTASSTPANPDVRDRDIWPQGSTSLVATYEDVSQDGLFTPIIMGLGAGNLYVNGTQIGYWNVQDEAGPTLRFRFETGTSQAYAAGTVIEVETQSILDVFAVEFPASWLDQFDNWVLNLGFEINKLESKLCRLLSGKSQDLALSAFQLGLLGSALSIALTTARAMFVAWLIPVVQNQSMTRALTGLRGIGAVRAETALREGRLGEFASMEPSEASHDGSALIVTQEYQNRVTTEEQYRLLSRSVVEIRARAAALTISANVVGDIRAAQVREFERRREGARRIEALQEKLP